MSKIDGQDSDGSNLKIRLNEELVLDAGWVEEAQRPDGARGWHVHPPVKTMFDQVMGYLSSIPQPDVSRSLTIGEEAVAATAVCLRWGSYLAVLADRDRPLMPQADDASVSRIADDEMARINIEASAALERWIDLMREDPKRYQHLARAALSHLPMTLRIVEISREPPALLALATSDMATRLVEAQPEKAEKVLSEVRAHPDRVLANAMVNFCWRNGPVEDTHAGRQPGYPLARRRIRPSEERSLIRTTAGRLAQGIVAVSTLLKEKSGRDWPEKVLPFHLAHWWLVTPTGWSLTEETRDVLLPGSEAEQSSRFQKQHPST